MMTVPTRVLLQDLQDKTEKVLEAVHAFDGLTFIQLCTKPNNGGWSIAECLQHLNLYGQYYLPHIHDAMTPNNLWQSYDTIYRSTWLGNQFANSMLPSKNGTFKKLKAPKSKQPFWSSIPETVLQDFYAQQDDYKKILASADAYNLNKAKTSISIMPIVKINLGDVLRFCVNHHVRHVQQAKQVFQELQLNNKNVAE
jgi:DinB superfamily